MDEQAGFNVCVGGIATLFFKKFWLGAENSRKGYICLAAAAVAFSGQGTRKFTRLVPL